MLGSQFAFLQAGTHGIVRLLRFSDGKIGDILGNVILEGAKGKIDKFDKIGLHYNIVADQIYKERLGRDPFDESFLPYIIAGLISFDLGRMMGTERYDVKRSKSFASRLKCKLQRIQKETRIKQLLSFSLTQIDLELYKDDIDQAYNILSAPGRYGLHNKGKFFHVGATKILHFLNPNLFIIVDSNAIRAFQKAHGVRPKHSAELYRERMKHARSDIMEHGLKNFVALDKPGVPITRIYDKLTFVTGYESRKSKHT